MRRSGHIALLATLAALLAAAPASATSITIGGDGETAPTFDLTQAIRERVFIPSARHRPGRRRSRPTRSRSTSCGRRSRARRSRSRRSSTPSPYYTSVGRGNEGAVHRHTDSDGLNDRWPLFYDNFFVPRGYAVILAESNGTGYSTGCPLHGGPGDVAGIEVGHRLAQRPRPGRRRGRQPRGRGLAQRQGGDDRQVLRRDTDQRRRGNRRPRADHDRPRVGDLQLVRLLAHRRRTAPRRQPLPGVAVEHDHQCGAAGDVSRRRVRRSTCSTATRPAT